MRRRCHDQLTDSVVGRSQLRWRQRSPSVDRDSEVVDRSEGVCGWSTEYSFSKSDVQLCTAACTQQLLDRTWSEVSGTQALTIDTDA